MDIHTMSRTFCRPLRTYRVSDARQVAHWCLSRQRAPPSPSVPDHLKTSRRKKSLVNLYNSGKCVKNRSLERSTANYVPFLRRCMLFFPLVLGVSPSQLETEQRARADVAFKTALRNSRLILSSTAHSIFPVHVHIPGPQRRGPDLARTCCSCKLVETCPAPKDWVRDFSHNMVSMPVDSCQRESLKSLRRSKISLVSCRISWNAETWDRTAPKPGQ